MESLTAEISDEEETTINGKGSNVIVLAADEAFDPGDNQWYCFYRSNYEYEIIPKLPSGVPIISVTDTGSGEFVLPAEYMNLDCIIRGDNNKLVSVLGVLYDESNTAYQNLASRKQLIDGKCIVSFDAMILNNALSQRKIVAEYKSVSESFVVIFKGSVSELPENPKHGCLCYMPADNKFHIYDRPADKWRNWLCVV